MADKKSNQRTKKQADTYIIGRENADKLLAVEGLSLSAQSQSLLSDFKAKGLTGVDLQQAITSAFAQR